MRRAAVLLAVWAVALLAPAARAAADPVASCTSTRGTIIAVDFHHWGGPIVRGCDVTNPQRGIDLLGDEGFRTTGTEHDGPQFVCRIGNEGFDGGTQYPNPAQDPCVATPPASAYWSYWVAPAGRTTWSYSQLGAFSDHPTPGEVQLWIFGGTHLQGGVGDPTDGFPTCSPDSLRAGGSPTSCMPSGSGASNGPGRPRPTSAPVPSRVRASSAAHRPAVTSAPHPSNAPTRTSVAPVPTRTVPRPAGKTSSAAGPDPGAIAPGVIAPGRSGAEGAASSEAVAVDAEPAAVHASTGSALPLVLGVSLAALFALGGGWAVRRRRRAGG